jgi:heme/copper-type cytochrome/quinol oxidase subunit 4
MISRDTAARIAYAEEDMIGYAVSRILIMTVATLSVLVQSIWFFDRGDASSGEIADGSALAIWLVVVIVVIRRAVRARRRVVD